MFKLQFPHESKPGNETTFPKQPNVDFENKQFGNYKWKRFAETLSTINVNESEKLGANDLVQARPNRQGDLSR